jgi:hypothetical protein
VCFQGLIKQRSTKDVARVYICHPEFQNLAKPGTDKYINIYIAFTFLVSTRPYEQHCCLLFWTSRVEILAQMPAYLIQVSRRFPQAFYKNYGMVSPSFHNIYNSLFINCSTIRCSLSYWERSQRRQEHMNKIDICTGNTECAQPAIQTSTHSSVMVGNLMNVRRN